MSSVYFAVSHYGDQKYPTCDHVQLSNLYDVVSFPIGDPRIKQYIDMGYYDHEIHSGIHYFDEVGFLKCKICGWKP